MNRTPATTVPLCLRAAMKGTIDDRLVWCIEKHKLLTPVQRGLLKHGSTTDYLVRLEKKTVFVVKMFKGLADSLIL